MQRIFVFGDSHTRTLRKAVSDEAGNTLLPCEFDIHWMLTEKNEVVRGDLKYEDAQHIVANLNSRDILVISLLGTAHNIFGLVQHERRFMLIDKQLDSIGITEDIELIPSRCIQDMFDAFCRKNGRIKELKSLSHAPVFHLMTPPPKQDNNFIKQKASRYRDMLISNEYDISPPYLRLRLYQLEMQALTQVCKEWGIDVIPPPTEAITPEGFLKEEYYGSDATHANSAYGKLVVQQLVKLCMANGL